MWLNIEVIIDESSFDVTHWNISLWIEVLLDIQATRENLEKNKKNAPLTAPPQTPYIIHRGSINLVNRLIPLQSSAQAQGGLNEEASLISLVLNCTGGSLWHPRASSSRWGPSPQLQAWPSLQLAH